MSDAIIYTADPWRIRVAPARGGKVTALHYRDVERNLLLPDSPRAGLALPDGSVFSVSGWDEAVPTVEASAGVPELGEAWRRPAACRVEPDGLHTTWEMPGWRMERVIAGQAETLSVRCAITNLTDAPAPLLWAGHVLFPLAGLREAALPGGELLPGPGCDTADLAARLAGGASGWRIRAIARRGASWKFFLPADTPVVLAYDDLRLTLTTDAGWWGIWLNEGHCCTLLCLGIEPTTAPTDALAAATDTVPEHGTRHTAWQLRAESAPAHWSPNMICDKLQQRKISHG